MSILWQCMGWCLMSTLPEKLSNINKSMFLFCEQSCLADARTCSLAINAGHCELQISNQACVTTACTTHPTNHTSRVKTADINQTTTVLECKHTV